MALVCLLALSAGKGWADRILLAPQGETLPPNTVKTEFTLSPYRRNENRTWLQIASPVGIELEVERLEAAGDWKKRHSLNVQYPLLPELTAAPALSLGVRDLFSTGLERQALYFVLGKNLRLSDRQARLLRDIRLHAGFGTGRMNGFFLGGQLRLRSGLSLSAELFRQRPNVGLGLPLTRNLQAQAYSLDGTVFYGLSFQITR